MKLGIVGLPNVGKSTLFNILTKAGVESANYPFCTIEPNIGVVHVPDERIEYLAKMHDPDKITYATIEFVDIAGLVKGASKGEGLGNKFLSHIREVDAICHVVRCFDDENIIHVEGSVGPMRDIETINIELIFADLEMVEKAYDKAAKLIKTGDIVYKKKSDFLLNLKNHLLSGKMANTFTFSEFEEGFMSEIFLLTKKPVIFVANIDETMITEDNALLKELYQYANEHQYEVIKICAKLEEEIMLLDDDEKNEFLEELGIKNSGLESLVKSSYKLLNLISYLTAGKKEVRAWTIENGTKAPQAAGKIHSDFEKGFIRAEIIAFDALKECGSMQIAKEKGLVRSEGRDYVFKDGDIVLFRFNV
ncbi:MAG: redox-regulated ATPase YchF [Clostridia bacterium]|nr:redox-regulated ATPase YchF [Clostridia bacterium]